jgi:hypothetical protein
MTERPETDHWLARPGTIRKLWISLIAFLALLLAGEAAFPAHPNFWFDRSFGFAAWLGFAACVVLVLGAKVLSIFLKRPDTYYDD